jgi:hypothetical protein
VDLRVLACWDRGFESRRGQEWLSLVSVVCFPQLVIQFSLIRALSSFKPIVATLAGLPSLVLIIFHLLNPNEFLRIMF